MLKGFAHECEVRGFVSALIFVATVHALVCFSKLPL
jgi:hypothetical protein